MTSVESMPLTSPRLVGRALRAARKEAGLTQVELAARAGVSQWWLVRLEKGKSESIELGRVIAVAETLGMVFRLAPLAPSSTPGDVVRDIWEERNSG